MQEVDRTPDYVHHLEWPDVQVVVDLKQLFSIFNIVLFYMWDAIFMTLYYY